MNQIPPTFQQGLDEFRAGRLSAAQMLFEKFLTEQPNHPDGLHMLGVVAYRAGRFDIAEQLVGRAISIGPAVAEYRANFGMVLLAQRRADEAIESFQHALRLRPNFADALCNLGNALAVKGQRHEAAEAFRAALAIRPDHTEAINNLGSNHQELGEHEQAIACFQRALALNPNYAEAHNNLGNVLKKIGRLTDAVASYQRALQIRPQVGTIWNNLGNTLVDGGQFEAGMAAYDQAIAAEPNRPTFLTSRLFALHFLPDISPEKMFQEHLNFRKKFAAELGQNVPANSNTRDPARRLRIGYVSPDFRDHSVARFMLNLLASHDRKEMEVFCYAELRRADELSAKFESISDHWRNTTGMADSKVAEMIRQDGIDILVDLAGHTASNRLLVFARKPAPVQITYLGYPDTTGLGAMDYRITDIHADPPGTTEQFHSEKLLRLPDSFLCFSPAEDSPEPYPMPAKTNGFITFACFNVLAKMNSPLIGWWCQIMRQVEDSRIFLKARGLSDDAVRERVLEQFRLGGIGPDRIDMRSWTSTRREHLESYRQVDIVLDTFPYNGTTITCEAMWMGVPVVTLAGRTHAQRVGVSLLTNTGLAKLIAESPEQYVEIAVKLAKDRAGLARRRNSLRKKMADSILTDGPCFVRQLEAVFRDVWTQWCSR